MMVELRHFARPYAKAAFAYALEKNTVAMWQDFLARAAIVAEDATMRQWIANPEIPSEKIVTIWTEILSVENEEAYKAFIETVIENRRLLVLPAILERFNQLFMAHEKQSEATVFTAQTLTNEQKEALQLALTKRLKNEVRLSCEIDEKLLGGAVIRMGDLVIDGSARGRLAQLAEYLEGK